MCIALNHSVAGSATHLHQSVYMQRLLVTPVYMSCVAPRLCVECTDGDLEEEEQEGRMSAVVMADWVTMHAGHTWLHPALLQLAQQVCFMPSTAACCGHQC